MDIRQQTIDKYGLKEGMEMKLTYYHRSIEDIVSYGKIVKLTPKRVVVFYLDFISLGVSSYSYKNIGILSNGKGYSLYPKDYKEKNYAGLTRKLSMTIQLSDPSEYEGGDLIVNDKLINFKTPGQAILFRSNLIHEVTPVTKGDRISLSYFIHGPRHP